MPDWLGKPGGPDEPVPDQQPARRAAASCPDTAGYADDLLGAGCLHSSRLTVETDKNLAGSAAGYDFR